MAVTLTKYIATTALLLSLTNCSVLKKKKNGVYESYFANGNVSTTEIYVNDKLSGNWKQFYENGKPREYRQYENGIMLSKKKFEWYLNGKLQESSSYVYIGEKEINDGEWLSYYENGQQKSSSYYKNGIPDGTWKGYYENGTVKYLMNYENGIFKTFQEFDEQGKLK